jgi:hypothetical protein
MVPNYYACSSCQEKLEFSFRSACYYVGSAPLAQQIAEADVLFAPARPAWCKDCEHICIAEDIAPLRAFEDAYGTVRAGLSVEYPIQSECWEPTEALDKLAAHLRWRMERRHAPRVLCCGGANFQFLDVEQPLFKHAGCEFGVVNPIYSVSSFNTPRPGVYVPANIRVYSTEGELIALLTSWKYEERKWDIDVMQYEPVREA